MRSILTKALVVLALLSAWVTYDNWDRIKSVSPASIKNAVQHSMPSISSEPKKTRVYQWQDANGKVHVSNTPPKDARNVKIIEYKDDLNVVVPSDPPAKKKRTRINMQNSPSNRNDNVFKKYTSAIDDAKQVQETMDQRNATLQERLQ